MSDEYDDIFKQLVEEDTKDLEEKKVESTLSTEITFGGKVIDTTNDDELTAMILLSALDDKAKADDLYDVFKTSVELSKDRSDSSKEALTSIIETRVNATTNLVKILDIRSKRKQFANNNFVNFQISPKKVGIDMKNINDNLEDFE
jgi:predicted nucleotidyltransferase component of viral defense system